MKKIARISALLMLIVPTFLVLYKVVFLAMLGVPMWEFVKRIPGGILGALYLYPWYCLTVMALGVYGFRGTRP